MYSVHESVKNGHIYIHVHWKFHLIIELDSLLVPITAGAYSGFRSMK